MSNSAIEEAAAALLTHRLGAMAPRAIDLLPIVRLVPLEFLLACEGGAEMDALASRTHLYSLERELAQRKARNNHSLDELVDCVDDLRRLHRRGVDTPFTLLAYSTTPRWERLASMSADTIRLVGLPADLKTQLDDKTWVRQELARAGIPVPSSRAVSGELDFDELVRELDEPIVVQRPVGASGVGTFLVQDRGGLAQVKERNPYVHTWLVSAFSGDCTLNLHGLVLEHQTLVSCASVQLVGIPELGSSFATYCGNDFGAAGRIPHPLLVEAEQLVLRIGKWLDSLDYRGLFGVDVVLSDGTVKVLEVNPRFQGSTWLLAEIELERAEVPLPVKHFLQWLGHPQEVAHGPQYSPTGAHMLLHWRGNMSLPLTCSVPSGIYQLDSRGRLKFRRSAVGLLECSENEFLLYGLPPQPRATVDPGAVLARVASRVQLGTADGRSLTDLGSRITRAVSDAVLPSGDLGRQLQPQKAGHP